MTGRRGSWSGKGRGQSDRAVKLRVRVGQGDWGGSLAEGHGEVKQRANVRTWARVRLRMRERVRMRMREMVRLRRRGARLRALVRLRAIVRLRLKAKTRRGVPLTDVITCGCHLISCPHCACEILDVR